MGFLEPLWPLFHPGQTAPRTPNFADIYPVLLQEGILADVRIFSERHGPRWRKPAEAIPAIAGRLGILEDAEAMERLDRVLRERAQEILQPRVHRAAVISWEPRHVPGSLARG